MRARVWWVIRNADQVRMWSMAAVAVMKVRARTRRISAVYGRMSGPVLSWPW
jgi:hypothetical protein